jgi:carboxypeptidase C (cathepsin A)
MADALLDVSALRRAAAALLLAFALVGVPALAEEAAKPAAEAPSKPAAATPEIADTTTTQNLVLKGHEVSFTVTAGSLGMRDGKGETQGTMFYVSYAKEGADKGSRPISFVFNGGPGAASAYLHLGALGPRVLDFAEDGPPAAASSHLVANPDTWLDFTDLVFVDPVGTGFSRPKSDEAAKQFWGVRQDIEELGQFVRRFLARADRLSSPKYLVGESYGGFRGARLPHRLAIEEGIRVDGAILISPVIEFGLMMGGEFNPLPDALRLPAYQAVALERTDGMVDMAKLGEAERFALDEYLPALVEGSRDPAKAAAFYTEVARRIGLPEDLVARRRGRIPVDVFQKEFRRDEGRIVSRYDGSASGPDPYPGTNSTRGGDPILEGTKAAFTSAMLVYYQETLGVKLDVPYRLLNGEVSGKWEWRSGLGGWGQGYVGAADELREALALDPRLKVMVAHGVTDLQTPYMTSRYVIDHLPPLGDRPRVELKLYQGGHMMYLRPGSRARLHADAAAFYGAGPGN